MVCIADDTWKMSLWEFWMVVWNDLYGCKDRVQFFYDAWVTAFLDTFRKAWVCK